MPKKPFGTRTPAFGSESKGKRQYNVSDRKGMITATSRDLGSARKSMPRGGDVTSNRRSSRRSSR